jgi:uncharacterized protein YcfJ
MSTAGRFAWSLSFEISPILLTRGIAQNLSGRVLPIVALTDGASLATGLLSSGTLSVDNFFAKYYVLPGGMLINQQVATYPFANQAVAANAVITQPLPVSMMMVCPARPGSGAAGAVLGAAAGGLAGAGLGTGVAPGIVGGALAGIGGYVGKLATISALQKSLAQHNSLGGTYTILTPSYIYTDCIMTAMRDVSSEGETKQYQVRWQLDFMQPLVLSAAAADSVLNSLAQKLQQGLPLTGPSQALGAAGLAAGGHISPLTAILPPVQGIRGPSLQVPQ